jgi:prolyl oligopeptidase
LYRYLTRYHTTTERTPEEIHQLGLAEVARIRTEMEAILREVQFMGTLEEFLKQLRTDPKFGFRTGDELLAEVRRICSQIEKELPNQFGQLPKSRFIVEPVPEFIAPDAPMAYYLNPSADGRRPGTYYINLYKPESRARYQLEALCLHEAVPGHHFQIARAFEREGVPAFRRFSSSGYTAFVEGWALYTESLGSSLGLYRDPYSRFGRLSEEMLRAVRLVVDTGMHTKRWSRRQAVDYAVANCASSLHEIETEIDRYTAWPGQALAYKVGERTLQALRKECETTLGPRWDVRAFHDMVLDGGSQPLDLLTQRVRAWAKSRP